MKTIEIIVSPKGESIVQTHGFEGSSCQAASKHLEEALGLRVQEELTTEFFASSQSLLQEQDLAQES